MITTIHSDRPSVPTIKLVLMNRLDLLNLYFITKKWLCVVNILLINVKLHKLIMHACSLNLMSPAAQNNQYEL